MDNPTTLERLLSRECTKESFCLLFSKLLQERLSGCSVQFRGETVLRLVEPDGKESTIYLDNLWIKYCEGNEDRAELLEKYVRMAKRLSTFETTAKRENIVAMIKDAEYMSLLEPRAKSVSEHLCGDLYVV